MRGRGAKRDTRSADPRVELDSTAQRPRQDDYESGDAEKGRVQGERGDGGGLAGLARAAPDQSCPADHFIGPALSCILSA